MRPSPTAATPASCPASLADPRIAPFFGAPPMAILAVGSATFTAAPGLAQTSVATAIDLSLWLVGTVLGLVVAVTIPARQFTSHRVGVADASPTWLLPVVTPMVSAATGASLVDRVSVDVVAHGLAWACLAMAGAAGFAAALTTGALWWRLAHHQHDDATTAPALWMVLGPLGQSVTAAAMLALHAPQALPSLAGILSPVAILIGVPTLGFAVLWLCICAAVTRRVSHGPLPYAMSWWAFTFPVGTLVTGASGVAALTGSRALGALAVAFLALLLAGWATSAWGTVRAMLARRSNEPALASPTERAATYAI
ncbi:C4-dicarboxylate ABC transporter [Demequina litorisediminis]|uniref:Tellurite resistance protein TehA n=1 Tax=Demequina litorisediminis TaxID=1849022 RepID=A0ABQ6IB81_9MICO|nr:C4-dicarboxylate ABC transporter [Demequina litorisediminis]GMA34008.1 hypothetical protein GCM10025876_02120 [Demequina litorisediminis]